GEDAVIVRKILVDESDNIAVDAIRVSELRLPSVADRFLDSQNRLIDVRLLVVLDAARFIQNRLGEIRTESRKLIDVRVALSWCVSTLWIGDWRSTIIEALIGVDIRADCPVEEHRVHSLMVATPMSFEDKRVSSRCVPHNSH